jgi:DtxR family Mn-dependent transcriptional regulator
LIEEFWSSNIEGDMSSATTPRSPSVSVGDYLKAIWELAGAGAASTTDVAHRLSVTPASVTNMFARLQETDLAEYERYRGASLTERGHQEALRLVRRHRLIETFLLERLGYPWGDVHEEAEQLEHAVSDEFTERLAELLGHPEHDPHGDPIPAADGTLETDDSFPLAATTAGQRVRIIRVGHENASMLDYLGEHGLVPGKVFTVREVRAVDEVVAVEDEDGESHYLGGPLAAAVFVQGAPEEGDG